MFRSGRAAECWPWWASASMPFITAASFVEDFAMVLGWIGAYNMLPDRIRWWSVSSGMALLTLKREPFISRMRLLNSTSSNPISKYVSIARLFQLTQWKMSRKSFTHLSRGRPSWQRLLENVLWRGEAEVVIHFWRSSVLSRNPQTTNISWGNAFQESSTNILNTVPHVLTVRVKM